jgi:pimeloyl-ACP methyl ester carboxylesterase
MASFAGLDSEFPFDSHHAQVTGARMNFLDEGSDGNGTGEVFLFVHGNPTWSFAWRQLVPEVAKTARAIAVDQIGCGQSEKPLDYDYSLEQRITALCELVTQLDLKRITLVAHDWGGAIGLGAAGRMPERFSRFVLMNTAAFRSKRIPLRIAVCRIPLLGTLALRGLNAFSRAALTMAVEKHDRMTKTVRRGYLAPYDSWRNRIAVDAFVKDIPLRPSHRSWKTLVGVEEGLSQFTGHPMLLVWGEQDWCFTTDFLDEFEQRFPQAETLRIPDAGHYVFEDAHEQIVPRLREFIAAHPFDPT